MNEWPNYLKDSRSLMVNKFTFILNAICLNSYLGVNLLFTFLTFIPVWKFFKYLYLPDKKYLLVLAFAMFCFPSIAAWSSLLLKDGIVLSFSCLFFYSIMKLHDKEKESFLFKYPLIGLVSLLIIINIRPFMIIPLISGSLVYFFLKMLFSIKNPILKFTTAPFLMCLFIFFSLIIVLKLSPFLAEFNLDNILETASIRRTSAFPDNPYSSMNFSFGNLTHLLIVQIPYFTFNLFLRPFFETQSNHTLLPAVFENILFFIIILIILIKIPPVHLLRQLITSPFFWMCITSVIIFSFFTAYTISNFGSLHRFRIFSLFFTLVAFINMLGMSIQKDKNQN